jgi:hypothetical protein
MTSRKPAINDRLKKNDESRQGANHHREPWSADEVAFLLEWDGTEEELSVVAECLGRTREACRERFYRTKRGECAHVCKHKPELSTCATIHTEPYLGVADNTDDQWWSSDYYRK